MGKFSQVCLVAVLMLTLLLPCGVRAATPDSPWSLIGFGAVYTPERLKDIFFNRHTYRDSYLAAVAINREFARTGASLGWEGEGQVVKHFGRQDHWEYNALVVARWYKFPWNRHLPTTLAVGEGVSFATRKPKLEAADNENASQLLNYLLFELTLAPSRQSRWYWSLRIHHRSGVFGLFNGVRGGSNFVGTGIGYRF